MIHPIRGSAALVVAGAVLSGPVAMLVVARTAPQPPWHDAGQFVQHYSTVQTLPYLLGFLLLGGFVVFSATCVALSAGAFRGYAVAGALFTGVYGTLAFINYTLQVGYIPRVLASDPSIAATLTMANPASVGWFLEMFAYAALGIATAFLAPGFGGSVRGATIRWLLVANAVVSVLGAVYMATTDRWVFSSAGLASFAGWNALVAICFGLIAATPGGGFIGGHDPGVHVATRGVAPSSGA